ncbi:hypothetical protein, partial [Streptomyces sp. NPDC002172]
MPRQAVGRGRRHRGWSRSSPRPFWGAGGAPLQGRGPGGGLDAVVRLRHADCRNQQDRLVTTTD